MAAAAAQRVVAFPATVDTVVVGAAVDDIIGSRAAEHAIRTHIGGRQRHAGRDNEVVGRERCGARIAEHHQGRWDGRARWRHHEVRVGAALDQREGAGRERVAVDREQWPVQQARQVDAVTADTGQKIVDGSQRQAATGDCRIAVTERDGVAAGAQGHARRRKADRLVQRLVVAELNAIVASAALDDISAPDIEDRIVAIAAARRLTDRVGSAAKRRREEAQCVIADAAIQGRYRGMGVNEEIVARLAVQHIASDAAPTRVQPIIAIAATSKFVRRTADEDIVAGAGSDHVTGTDG